MWKFAQLPLSLSSHCNEVEMNVKMFLSATGARRVAERNSARNIATAIFAGENGMSEYMLAGCADLMRASFDAPCSFHSMLNIAMGEKSTFFTDALRVLGIRTRKPLRPSFSV